jgi:dTDP-4-dehydrorhamnose 3,5-epimerase-like enzyme
MLIELLKPDFRHTDERGKLTQLIRDGYKQINIVESNAGCFRGGHYHKLNKEVFYIICGEIKFTARKDGESETLIFKSGDMFLVPPYVAHDFLYLTNTILVGMYDNGVELGNGEMDIYCG